MRKPGKVFSVEFNSEGVRKVAIIEEERDDSDFSFYNTRVITIFTRAAKDWNDLMKSSMTAAYKKLGIGGILPQPVVSKN